MSEHVEQTIAMIREEIIQLESDLVEKKRLVNHLCVYAKMPPIFGDAELLPASAAGSIRPDEYYGQPLAKAIRMVLERRQAANIGPASVGDIYDAMLSGGFKFDTKNDENAKRGLYTALTKNTATFHKLPNGLYGLLEWYPNAKETKARVKPEKNGTETEPDDDDRLKGLGFEQSDFSQAFEEVTGSATIPKKG